MEEARALLGTFVDFLYFPLTTFLSIAGGLLLWFGFFTVGVIARCELVILSLDDMTSKLLPDH